MRRAALAVLLLSGSVAAQNWPGFRGPNSMGVAAGASVPVNWDVANGKNVAWKTPIPGLAHASPIVWGDRVYIVSAATVKATDVELKIGDGDTSGIDSARDNVRHLWRLFILDRKTGKILREQVIYEGTPRVKRHVKASHASATPVTDGRYVVVLAGSEGLFTFDMDGQLLWKEDLGVLDVGLVDDHSYQWGPGSSPVIYQDLVIVQNDRHENSYLAAYHLKTGKRAWWATREEMPSWATPFLYTGPGRAELVTNSPNRIRGYDPATGKELWRLNDGTQVKTPTPVGADGVIVVTGGYPPGARPIFAIPAGSGGNLAATPGEKGLLWKHDRGSSYTPTPLILDGILYIVTDHGILSAYDLKTGARHYQQRIAAGGSAGFSASPVAAGERIYFASEDGDVFVVRAGKQFELLARNPMNEVLMATPAVTGSLLIVRTRTHVYGLSEGKTAGN